MKPSLQDRADIIDLTHTYCWALDSKDFALLDDVFLPDARGDMRTKTILEGREAIVSRISAAINLFDATQHLVGNHRIDVADDGDHATCRTYLQSMHVKYGAESGENYLIGGHYEDELVRTADGWRIAFRRLVSVWTDGNVEIARRPSPPAATGG